jgi:U3 small nucleolar RNA-associated protein 22
MEPLIVDFTGSMTSQDVDSINNRLKAWRKIDPAMNRTVLFAASNHDPTGTAFTANGPTKLIASRMTALARSACKLVKEQGMDLNQRSLFATSTADYDFTIHLTPNFTGEIWRKDSSQPKYKNLEVRSRAELELVGYQPVKSFVDELKKTYADSVVFFHSAMAGSVIAGLWNPRTEAPRLFKVNLAYATQPVDAKDEEDKEVIELDKSAILAEIARFGGDMVAEIVVR